MKKSILISFVLFFLVFSLTSFPQQQVRKLKTVKQIQKPLLTVVNHWPKWCDKAMKATADAIGLWSIQVKIINGRINGPSAIAPAGCLSSPSMRKNIKSFMIANLVPGRIAAGFANGISAQWEKWQSKVTIPGLPLYPSFAAWPGPTAPPTRGVPMPLAAFTSGALLQLTKVKIKNALISTLGNQAASVFARKALIKFAADLELRFLVWLGGAKVVNLVGQGPVPAYAPPFYPTGPVVNGTILPNPGILSTGKF